MNALTPANEFDLLDETSGQIDQGPHLDPREQAKTLRQLAAFQLAHGNTEVADHLSAIAFWLTPKDAGIMRLRAHALARRGEAVAGLKLLISAGKASPGSIKLGDWVAFGVAFARQSDVGYAKKLLFRARTQ